MKDNLNLKQIFGVILISVYFFCILFYSTDIYNFFGGKGTELNYGNLVFSRISIWAGVLLIFLYSRFIEKQNLLIWKEENYPLIKSFLKIALLILYLGLGAILIKLFLNLIIGHESETTMKKLIDIFSKNKWLIFTTTFTAGVTEELIFRGYIFTRIFNISKNKWFAMIFSGILFGFMHFKYHLVSQIIFPTYVGILFAWYYEKYRNIKVLIIAHFLFDFFMFSNLLFK